MTALPPLTQIEKVEQALVFLLKDALDATFFVDVFPEEPEKFDDAKYGRAALLQYRGSDYQPRDGLDAGALTRVTGFVVHLVYNAHAKGGSRPIKDIERLRMELQGRDVEGGALELKRDGLAEQGAARRRYILELQLAVPTVARPHRPLTPLMTEYPRETA